MATVLDYLSATMRISVVCSVYGVDLSYRLYEQALLMALEALEMSSRGNTSLLE